MGELDVVAKRARTNSLHRLAIQGRRGDVVIHAIREVGGHCAAACSVGLLRLYRAGFDLVPQRRGLA